MTENKVYLQIYLLLISVIAVALLILIGINGLFYWSLALLFLSVACALSEWLVIRLPQGDRFTLSIVFVVLALLFGPQGEVSFKQASGPVVAIGIGALVGYALIHHPPLLTGLFYAAQYILAASCAGGLYVLTCQYISPWLIEAFHLPAIAVYVLTFSLISRALVGELNRNILQGQKLPQADPLLVISLTPIALIVYYFFQMRGEQFSVWSVVLLALPLLGILATFRMYINIDTEHGEVTQLYEISKRFVASMSQEETVQRISQSIAQAIDELVPCDACLMYVRGGESNEYLLANLEDGGHGPVALLPEQGFLGRILASGNSQVLNDVSSWGDLSAAEQKWGAKTAVMAFPLHAETQVIGLMALVRYRRTFTSEDFRMVGIIANQVGVPLHNALMYERSLQMAQMDHKLDILNQAAFMQRAQRVMGRAQLADQPVALLLGDIDDFRKINNQFGHPTGDKVLAGVAQLMKQYIGESGFVGRRGGEEFAIMLANVNEVAAIEHAEQVRQRVQEYVFKSDDGQDVRATISVGVALFPRDASDIMGLDRVADRAAYLAKRLGKNRVCLYEDQKEKLASLVDLPQPSSPDVPDTATAAALLSQEERA
ncbi:MAG: sensor domain-containing diguanylate cyclase [Anaerolineae bacterium]|nr:sensor domain-containing diguanylate cyclase [Anaerolineae bacterium]